jgi:hypothetical protein
MFDDLNSIKVLYCLFGGEGFDSLPELSQPLPVYFPPIIG